MSATTSVRTAVKQRLIELLEAAADDGVQVSYAWPGDLMQECIFLGGSVGFVTIPNLKVGRKQRDDTFTIVVGFRAGRPGQTDAVADARCEELYACLENLLADDPTLGGLDGVLHASQNGPCNFDPPEASAEGFTVDAAVEVAIRTRLS